MRAASKVSLVRWRRETIIDVYQLALGLLLFVSPWLFAYSRSTVRIETWGIGLAVIALSIGAIVAFSEWEEWLNVFLGAWLIAAPWILGFLHTAAMHVSIGVGLVIAYLALLDLWLIHYRPEGMSGSGGST